MPVPRPLRRTGEDAVLFLAQLPPPHHGQSEIAAAVHRVLCNESGFDIVHRWRGGASELTDIGRRTLGKYLGFVRLLVEVLIDAVLGRRYRLAYVGIAPWAHTVIRDALLAGAAKLVARRVWVHVHGSGLEKILRGSGPRNWLIRSLLSGTELIAITGDTCRVGEASGIFSRVAELANAARDPGPRDLSYSVPLTIGCLCNLDPRKGVLDFIGIVAGLANRGLPIRGIIVGGETSALTLEQTHRAIAAHDAESVIRATGRVDEATKSEILADTDVFLYLSRHDLAPVALIEAMAHGASPIVLDVGGLREMVGPGLRDNVLDPKDDPAKIAAHVESIIVGYISDARRLVADKKLARERYFQSYSPVRFAERIRNLVAAR